MHPLSVPLIIKTSSPVLTYTLLSIVIALMAYIVFLMFQHHRITRAAKKRGDSTHTGRHGNH